MAGTDSIVIPVELGNLDVEKFLQQLGPKLKQRIAEVARGMVGGQIPQIPTTVVAKERMDIGSKTFEATSRAKLSAIQQSIGEGGEQDLLALEKFALSIREVRKQLTAEEKTRLENIKQLTATAKQAMKEKREFVKSLVQLDTAGVEKQLMNEVRTEEQERRAAFKGLEATAKKAMQMKKEFIKSLVQLDTSGLEKQLVNEAKQVEQEKNKTRTKARTSLKSNMSVQTPEENIRSVQQAVRDGLLTIEEGNILIAKESRKFVAAVASGRRKGFSAFTKRLQTIDPNLAIDELNKYIDNRTSAFVQDAKILRDRLQKQIQSARQQAQQIKTKNFANSMLTNAGIGMGILGTAGFPLLNIGFAAMSGTPLTTGIVALSTAVGEASRAFNRFSESTKAAARDIGLVSTGFKVAEAQQKIFDAFIGQGAMSIKRAATELNIRDFQSGAGGLREFNKLFENIKESAKSTGAKMFIGDEKPGIGDFLQPGGQGIGSFFARIFAQRFNETKNLANSRDLTELLEARRNFILQMSKSSVGIETNPYETWKRIQTAAFDPTKAEEMRIFQAMLADLDKMVAAEEAKVKDKGSKKTSYVETLSPFGIF